MAASVARGRWRGGVDGVRGVGGVAASMALEASMAWQRRWRGVGVGGVASASVAASAVWRRGRCRSTGSVGGSRGADGVVGVDSPHYA